MRFSQIFAIGLIPFACSTKVKSIEPPQDSPIVIIGIDRLDRNGFAQMFQRLSECKPAVVGVMTLLDEADSSDGQLSQSIDKMGNVVLSTIISEDSVIKSMPEIIQNANTDGFVQFVLLSNKAVGHQMLYDVRNEICWSFPLSVLAVYDINKAEQIFEASEPDIVYGISYEYPQETFLVFDGVNELECSKMEGKIVLIGYTGLGSDKYLVQLNNKVVEMNITTAMANAILHLLNSEGLEEIR